MKDKTIDELLRNIEPDINEKKQTLSDDNIPEDSQFNEDITIDLDPFDIVADAEKDKRSSSDEINKLDPVKKNISFSKLDKPATADKIIGEPVPGTVAQPVKFTVKGNRTWNIREPYIININDDRLKQNYDDLSETIYFVDSPENETSIQGKIKLSLLRNISGASKELILRYKEYIYRSVIHITDELTDIYSFKGDKKKLFLYHTGVLTIYRIIIGHFQNFKIGQCYKRLPDKKVTKFHPSEYIKAALLNWYEDNINIFNLPFDGIHEFNDFKRIVTGKYYFELEKYNKHIDETIIKLKLNTDKKFNREEYARNMWDEWFGTMNIITYNRFIERTIFKFSDRHIHR